MVFIRMCFPTKPSLDKGTIIFQRIKLQNLADKKTQCNFQLQIEVFTDAKS